LDDETQLPCQFAAPHKGKRCEGELNLSAIERCDLACEPLCRRHRFP
jgi:hypothetical protein